MTTKTKVNNMSEEDEKKMAQWIQESKGRSSLLPDEKMAERYPVAYSMLGDDQQELSAKDQPKKDETVNVTDSNVVTPSVTVTEPMSAELTQEEPPMRRVSSKQRRLSLEEYRSVYLPVPKIENRMPVFISASLRDELDKIARRLGDRRMSASGIVENMVKHHLIVYGDELKEWYKFRR